VIHGVNLTQNIVRKIGHFKFLVSGSSILSHSVGIGDSSSFLFVEANCNCGNLIVFGLCKCVSYLLVIS